MAETESKAQPPADGSQGVQLGIGTLIVIALIVTMCSGKGEVEKIRKDTSELKQQVGELHRKLDTLIQKEAAAPELEVEAPTAPPATGTTPAQNP